MPEYNPRQRRPNQPPRPGAPLAVDAVLDPVASTNGRSHSRSGPDVEDLADRAGCLLSFLPKRGDR